MSECQIFKTDKPNLFMAMDDALDSVQPGEVITVKYRKARNPRFHRKAFALFKFLFDALPEPDSIKFRGHDVVPVKDFDTVRKELTVMAGFYEVVGRVDGSVKLTAKSLSFASMDDEEFGRVYSALIDVGLRILPYTMTGEELERAADNLIVGFG